MNTKAIFRAINRLAQHMDYERAFAVVVCHPSILWDHEEAEDAHAWWADYCYCRRVIAMHGESGLY